MAQGKEVRDEMGKDRFPGFRLFLASTFACVVWSLIVMVELELQLGYVPFWEWLAFSLAGNSMIAIAFVRDWEL